MIRSAREGVPVDAVNIHATAVVLDHGAVLITGRAGAGKTSLALALVERWQSLGRFGRLLSDDQVFLTRSSGRLEAHAPAAIAGLVEIRGVGIVEMPFVSRCRVDLVADLGGGAVSALSGSTVTLLGAQVPLLRRDHRSPASMLNAVDLALAAIRSGDSAADQPNMLDPDNDLGLPSGERRTT